MSPHSTIRLKIANAPIPVDDHNAYLKAGKVVTDKDGNAILRLTNESVKMLFETYGTASNENIERKLF